MEWMSLLGFGACVPDPSFRSGLPFPAFDINRDAIPPLLRRRTSQATQIAFSAAATACTHARRSPTALPSIFASVAGEIQTTDLLCIELAKPEGLISPSAFHNSVQNTAAGYWSIAQQCTQPASALASGSDTFAMALLEAWCQLACQGGELLLVCYDETWPSSLEPDLGEPAFASALVLASGSVEGSLLHIGRPHREGNAVELAPPPNGWRLGGGQVTCLDSSNNVGNSSVLARPHPNPPPMGEGTVELNSTLLPPSEGELEWGRCKSEGFPPALESLIAKMPVLAAIPLLSLATVGGDGQNTPISPAASGWLVKASPLISRQDPCRHFVYSDKQSCL